MATLKLTNHSHIRLTPPVIPAHTVINDINDDVVQPYITDVFQQADPNNQLAIDYTDDAGNTQSLTIVETFNLISATIGETINQQAEDLADQLYSQLLQFYATPTQLTADDVFINQALNRSGLAQPTPTILYGAAHDIIPAADTLMQSHHHQNTQRYPVDQALFFGSVGATFRPHVLAYGFHTADDFEDFKAHFKNLVAPLVNNLSSETQTLLQRFDTLTLNGLTESLKLRNDTSPQVAPYCFARLLTYALASYAQGTDTVFEMPFSLSEALWPENLVLVNVSEHSRARPQQIEQEWSLINKATALPYTILSQRQLNQLTRVARGANLAGAPNSHQSAKGLPRAATLYIKARGKASSATRIGHLVLKTLKSLGKRQHSMNAYLYQKTTFAKPSRRHPDNPNIPGRTQRQSYRPDLHIWLDTSGSIDEDNYAATIKMLIVLAKKLNINIYFNSFSHVLSPTSVLKVKGKSLGAIYREFQKITKVNGGTDYEQIYSYIQAHPKIQDRMHLLLTDFEFAASRVGAPHPKNLYYAPMANMSHQDQVNAATYFARTIEHRDPNIRSRMFGIFV